MSTRLRPADCCLITRQPLFCPECRSPLDERGHCTDYWEKCEIYLRAEYENGGPPYPSYSPLFKRCAYCDRPLTEEDSDYLETDKHLNIRDPICHPCRLVELEEYQFRAGEEWAL